MAAGTDTATNLQQAIEDRLSQVVSDVTKVAAETKASQGDKIVGPQVPLKPVMSFSAEEMTKQWDRFQIVFEGTPDPRRSAQRINEPELIPYCSEILPRLWTSESGIPAIIACLKS